jgi:hypothetical protein
LVFSFGLDNWFFSFGLDFLDLDVKTVLVFLDLDNWFFLGFGFLILVFHWFWMFWFFIGIRYVARLSEVKVHRQMIQHKQ